MRHCRFFQLCLGALAENTSPEERSLIWPQFNVLFKDFQMPQEHIEMFTEHAMGTDLYTRFWTPDHRARLVLFLTHYFKDFRATPFSPASSTEVAPVPHQQGSK
jgi:hypothetical protein